MEDVTAASSCPLPVMYFLEHGLKTVVEDVGQYSESSLLQSDLLIQTQKGLFYLSIYHQVYVLLEF